MSLRDKRLVILHQLSLETSPVSLSYLHAKMGLDYTQRTIRRCLQELTEEGLVEKSGSTRNAKYIAVGRSNQKERVGVSSCFGSGSLKSIELVKKPIYQRTPIAYNEEWFDSYIPNETYYLPRQIRFQLEETGSRMHCNDPAGTYAHQIFNRLLIDLSYNSSRLEGNTYSLLDTERLLLKGAPAPGKLDFEKLMILNHKEAIRYLVENASSLSPSEETIYTIHYLLSADLLESDFQGKVRDHGVRVGGTTYIPYEDPKMLKIRMGEIAKKALAIENVFEQSLFLLIHISYLQAFSDVNKRTARLCANIPLILHNFVPLSFNDVDVDDYMTSTIAIYELQDVNPLIDLYVFSYIRTCRYYDSTVKSMDIDEVRVRYRAERREVVREIVKAKLIGSSLDHFILEKSPNLVPQEVVSDFMGDVREDLKHLDPIRIAGMGITLTELKEWLKVFKQR